MIKLIGTAYKRDDFTTREFFDYWRDTHAAISAKSGPLRGFVASEVISNLENPNNPNGEGEIITFNAGIVPALKLIIEDDATVILRLYVRTKTSIIRTTCRTSRSNFFSPKINARHVSLKHYRFTVSPSPCKTSSQ